MGGREEPIGQFLKRARNHQDMSAATLAKALGVRTKTIYRWEKDEGAPSIAQAKTMARVLEVSLEELTTGEAPAAPASSDLLGRVESLERGLKDLVRQIDRGLARP